MDKIDGGLKDLIERLEASHGPDRALDCEIAVAFDVRGDWCSRPLRELVATCGMDWLVKNSESQQSTLKALPNYTSSIDAALTLVPEGDDIWLKIQHARYDGHPKVCTAGFETGKAPYWHGGMAVTFPLALCIAALRAREK